jgi:hypothetical protein
MRKEYAEGACGPDAYTVEEQRSMDAKFGY